MCGRYRLSRRKQIIAEHFDAPFDDDWTPRYNIAASQPVPVRVRATTYSLLPES
jgi:putative SOS response-associated peptidase YedK